MTFKLFCLTLTYLLMLFAVLEAEGQSRKSNKEPKPQVILKLWNGTAPGEKGDIGEEKDTTPPDPNTPPEKYIIRLGNVSQPTISVYRPPKEKETGAAVLVCPGGGYHILAMNLEGTEVCEWLNSIGVTAILLKYRVPVRKDQPRYAAPLQDAQRAMGMIRANAKQWGIDPNRIGVLGFSAGAHLSATLSTNYETRTYPPQDEADKLNCRPDFVALIYPAYLTQTDDLSKVSAELKITTNTPPTILAMTQDDPVKIENVFTYGLALRKANVPVELHIYAKGGHGYGLRPSENTISEWPQHVEKWLKTLQIIKPRTTQNTK